MDSLWKLADTGNLVELQAALAAAPGRVNEVNEEGVSALMVRG